ncbi:hypothetical protein GEMRC1_009736 [Eukaryota sp. GEM-RC1]
MVNLSHNGIGFNTLLAIFKQFSIHQSPPTIEVLPHSIDISRGIISYADKIKHNDLRLLLNTLKSKVPIQRVECRGITDLNIFCVVVLYQILSINNSVMDVNISPYFIDTDSGIFSFSPPSCTKLIMNNISALRSLGVKKLRIHNCSFTDDAFESFCDFIRTTTSLTSLDLSYCYISEAYFLKLIDALQSNPKLNNVNLSNHSIGFRGLLTIFDLVSAGKLTPNIQFSPHSCDFSIGAICYDSHVDTADLCTLLNALKSNVPIKRVEFSRLKNLSLGGIITSFEILSINKSVIDVDVFPHFVDIDNGAFRFSPETFTQISAQELSSLHCVCKSYSFRELTFKNCHISNAGISELCDIIRTCHVLTSVDFSHCRLSYSSSLKFITALQSISCLKKVYVSNIHIEFHNLLDIFKQFSTHQSSPTIEFFPHSIDFSRGIIRYAEKIKNTDLGLLLNALKSNVPIKRVECHGIANLNFAIVVVLFQILSINNSLMDDNISPHFINVECGSFSFRHKTTLKFMLRLFLIYVLLVSKVLTFTIVVLRMMLLNCFCDLVKTSTSLTSLDLLYCDLSYADLLRIITSIRNVSSLSVRKINFGKQRSVKALADLLEENTTLSKIDLWGNSISMRNALELLKMLKLNSTIECINLGNIVINEITGQDINTISNGRIAFLTT